MLSIKTVVVLTVCFTTVTFAEKNSNDTIINESNDINKTDIVDAKREQNAQIPKLLNDEAVSRVESVTAVPKLDSGSDASSKTIRETVKRYKRGAKAHKGGRKKPTKSEKQKSPQPKRNNRKPPNHKTSNRKRQRDARHLQRIYQLNQQRRLLNQEMLKIQKQILNHRRSKNS